MNIALFGGSFDPPHLGHLIVIQQAFELIPHIDQLWLLPANQHTFQKPLSAANHRLAMCQLLIDELPDNFRSKTLLCPIEIDYHSTGSTYHTLHLLQKEVKYLQTKQLLPANNQLPTTNYSFLMGSDQLPGFHKWDNYQELLKAIPFYVYPRAGHNHPLTYSNMNLLTSPHQIITNISSTLIRHRREHQLSIDSLVPNKILGFITKHKLYRYYSLGRIGQI